MSQSDDCASNIHDFCNPCDCECHKKTEFNIEEIRALWRLLSHYYIPYEDDEALKVVRKISRLLEENDELGARNSQPTQRARIS